MSFVRTIFSRIPLIELASKSVQQFRESQCVDCPFYKFNTGSCGTLIVGETIEWKNEQVHLCGCIISEKSELKNQHCPIKQW